MSTTTSSLTPTSVGYAFDHPEAVAWGPDGRAYAGGEAGQLYRFNLDGSGIETVAQVEGGFLLGLAHDAKGNGGPDMKTLIIANLCGWTVNTSPVAVPGLKLRYPEIP